MSALIAAREVELEPLECSSLSERFPNLRAVTDREVMRANLQSALLDGTEFVAESCGRPKVEVDGGACWLQYPLQTRAASGDMRELLVLGAMFSERNAANALESSCLAPLAARLPPTSAARPKPTAVLESLGTAVSVFPVNSRLPTLVDATNTQQLDDVLRPLLAQLGETAPIDVELVRFRLTRGCVLRYRLNSSTEQTVFGKVGYTSGSDGIREGLDALVQRAVAHMNGAVVVPRVLGHVPELDLTLISRVPGSSPDLESRESAQDMIERAALIAASLHTSGVVAGLPHTVHDELGRARRGVEQIREHAPALAGWLTEVLGLLDDIVTRTTGQPSVCAHGSFAPSQLMVDGSRTGILDFDKLCQAEPAFDIGRFLAPLRVTLAKRWNVSTDALASRFVETYHAAGGPRTSKERIAGYEIASLVRMAAHSWLQLKVGRLQSVCAILEQRVAQLELRP